MVKILIVCVVAVLGLTTGYALASTVDGADTVDEAHLWTSCKETSDGRMAITLPPALKGDDEAIQKAVGQCRMTLSNNKMFPIQLQPWDSIDPNIPINSN